MASKQLLQLIWPEQHWRIGGKRNRPQLTHFKSSWNKEMANLMSAHRGMAAFIVIEATGNVFHKIIQFELSVPEIEKRKRTVMSEENKTNFAKTVEKTARDLLNNCDKVHTNIRKVESTVSTFINGVKEAHKANSRTYSVKVKPKGVTCRDKRVRTQIKE